MQSSRNRPFDSKKKSGFAEIWRRYKKSKTAVFGLAVLAVILFLALSANFFLDYEGQAITQNNKNRLAAPTAQHWFGTDEYGRDTFTRVIFGARNSLFLAFTATAISLTVACFIGSVVAFYGGMLDNVVMRILDMFMGIPLILLAIAVSAALGPGMRNLILAITVAQVPNFTRIVRSVILSIVGQEYIEAARSYGSSDMNIIVKQILPNAIGLIIVQATMSISTMILTIAALSYIGMGMQPPAPELGAMLNDGKEFMRYSPFLVVFPGLTIAITALSLNLMGDGLRDALDPRLKN